MAALVTKGVPFEIEYIELNNKPQWFLDISPNGQVPVLVSDNGVALFESDAIVEYLDDKYPPTEKVSAEQKALDRAWSYKASKNYMSQCATMASKDEETFNLRLENLRKCFAKAETQLGEWPFFKGSDIANVDIAWLPLLHRADVIKQQTGFDMLEGFPKVQKWQDSIKRSGLIDKTVHGDFVAVFSNFYLTNTFLATLMNDEEETQSNQCCASKVVSCCD
jgi:glutathione S-transferase